MCFWVQAQTLNSGASPHWDIVCPRPLFRPLFSLHRSVHHGIITQTPRLNCPPRTIFSRPEREQRTTSLIRDAAADLRIVNPPLKGMCQAFETNSGSFPPPLPRFSPSVQSEIIFSVLCIFSIINKNNHQPLQSGCCVACCPSPPAQNIISPEEAKFKTGGIQRARFQTKASFRWNKFVPIKQSTFSALRLLFHSELVKWNGRLLNTQPANQLCKLEKCGACELEVETRSVSNSSCRNKMSCTRFQKVF